MYTGNFMLIVHFEYFLQISQYYEQDWGLPLKNLPNFDHCIVEAYKYKCEKNISLGAFGI